MSARLIVIVAGLLIFAVSLIGCKGSDELVIVDHFAYEKTLIEVRQRSKPLVEKYLMEEELTEEDEEELAEIIKLMSAAIKYDPVRSLNHFQMGKLHQMARDDQAALNSYNQAYKLLPENPQTEDEKSALYVVLVERGAVAARLLMYETAYESYLRAFELMPHDPRSGYNAASLAVELGQTEKAKEILSKVLASNPDDEDARQLMEILETTA